MKLPTFVAEISGNHLSDRARAEELVVAAARAGAEAVKFQTYDPERLVGPRRFRLRSGPWAGKSLITLYQDACTPSHWLKRLFALARGENIIPFSSPFSPEDVDTLEEVGCPIYKIASPEIVDLELVRYAAQTKKPLVISTGMATLVEIEAAVDTALNSGARTVTILKCTSGYPAPAEESNLLTLRDLREYFAGDWEDRIHVGLSDHTLGIGAAVAAIVLGATMVEKHITMSRAAGGPDAGFSCEPSEFKMMVETCRQAHAAIGEVCYGHTTSEEPQLDLRRALWVVADVLEGQELTRSNLRSCRPCTAEPGAGRVEMLDIRSYLGRKAKRAIPAWTLFLPEMAA